MKWNLDMLLYTRESTIMCNFTWNVLFSGNYYLNEISIILWKFLFFLRSQNVSFLFVGRMYILTRNLESHVTSSMNFGFLFIEILLIEIWPQSFEILIFHSINCIKICFWYNHIVIWCYCEFLFYFFTIYKVKNKNFKILGSNFYHWDLNE